MRDERHPQDNKKSHQMKLKESQKDNTSHVIKAQSTDEIIADMQEEEAEARRRRILENMTPACREKYRYIESWLRKEVGHLLRSRYDLGLQVKEIYEDEKKNGGKLYGKDAIGRICKLLRWDDGVIQLSLRFVRAYTPADLDHLCSLVLPRGLPLSWSHVRTLLCVDSKEQRQALLDRTVKEGWTCDQLAYEVKHLSEGKTPDGRGRPPRIPKNFDDAVTQQLQSAEQWDNKHCKVWANPDRSLVAQAAKLPAEEVTEERLRQAQVLAHQLRRVAQEAQEQAEKAEAVVRDFERILDERQQAKSSAKSKGK